jgi:hypothetical protein
MSNFNLNFDLSHRKGPTFGWRELCFVLMLVVLVMPVGADIKVEKRSISENLVMTLKGMWNSLWYSSFAGTAARGRGMNTEGLSENALVLPFLEGSIGDAKLIAGQRDLSFWLKEGKPPYTVEVKKQGGTKETKTTNANEVTFNLALDADAVYWVTATDSSANTAKTKFKVVAFDNLPKPTADQKRTINNSPAPLSSCVEWLAKQGTGEWLFEVYQLSKNNEIAQIKSICGIN